MNIKEKSTKFKQINKYKFFMSFTLQILLLELNKYFRSYVYY